MLALDYLLQGGNSGCYNLGAGTCYSVNEIIKAVETHTGRKVPIKVEPRRSGDPPSSLCGSTIGGRDPWLFNTAFRLEDDNFDGSPLVSKPAGAAEPTTLADKRPLVGTRRGERFLEDDHRQEKHRCHAKNPDDQRRQNPGCRTSDDEIARDERGDQQRYEDHHQRDAADQHARIAHRELHHQWREDETRGREDHDDRDKACGGDLHGRVQHKIGKEQADRIGQQLKHDRGYEAHHDRIPRRRIRPYCRRWVCCKLGHDGAQGVR